MARPFVLQIDEKRVPPALRASASAAPPAFFLLGSGLLVSGRVLILARWFVSATCTAFGLARIASPRSA